MGPRYASSNLFRFAYAEFADKEGMQMALAMSDSLLKGRQIKVMEKRTNRPGISTTNRPPRGRGYRGRGGFAGAPPGYIIKYVPVGGYRPRGARGLRRPRGFLPYTPEYDVTSPEARADPV
ncbi:hypothetical protein TELCIR_06985 [Teladorsagia circumcincta]|uniref:RRM domain-containing protein n=1 Tax=Teladorsagia circumcincta TaxID=45464 RepID=A0A2G9ULM8_TELCI|nr:hypothetical protein TELCIR_06985 [Teladorsagia circumcincta]